MKSYEISSKAKSEFAKDIRLVQGAIAKIANAAFSVYDKPQGIFKYEGGVVVNNSEIAIHSSFVKDDWVRHFEPSKEEIAVSEAIRAVALIVEQGGIKALLGSEICDSGDPLRMLVS